jgi:hypothetical protein
MPPLLPLLLLLLLALSDGSFLAAPVSTGVVA